MVFAFFVPHLIKKPETQRILLSKEAASRGTIALRGAKKHAHTTWQKKIGRATRAQKNATDRVVQGEKGTEEDGTEAITTGKWCHQATKHMHRIAGEKTRWRAARTKKLTQTEWCSAKKVPRKIGASHYSTHPPKKITTPWKYS